MTTDRKSDFEHYLNTLLRSNPVWRRLSQAITEVVETNVREPRLKLSRLRHHTQLQRGDYLDTPLGKGKVAVIRRQLPTTDAEGNPVYEDIVEVELPGQQAVTMPVRTTPEREVAIGNSQMLGFDFFSDKLSDLDYQRVMRFVGNYWPYSGNENFAKMLGFIANIRFEIAQLWTPDRADPVAHPETDSYISLEQKTWREVAIYNSPDFDWAAEYPEAGYEGYYYPTSHVALAYDVVRHGTDIDFATIINLFYYMAPIHLVLERFVAAVYAPTFEMHSGAVGSIDFDLNTNYTWTPDTELLAQMRMIASHDMDWFGFLCLDNTNTSMVPMTREYTNADMVWPPV